MIYIVDQVLVWLSWIFLLVFREIPRKLRRPPSIHALPPIPPSPQAPSQPLEPLPTEQEDSTDTNRRETFYITNVHTGAYAALLDDNDRSELVGVTLNLMARPHRGAEVNICVTLFGNFNSSINTTVVDYAYGARPIHDPERQFYIFCWLRQSTDRG